MTRAGRREWLWVAGVILLAAIVYRPWEARALPLTDFGTFLPMLGASESPWTQLVTITSHYIAEGRICILQYLMVVIAGDAFGMWAPGWYWTYFALNATVIALGWAVLRRTGVGTRAAFFALAIWTTMSATPEVWLRPTGEPIALIFFLIALYHAVGFGTSHDWRRRIAIIAACAAGIIFAKEMLVVLLPAGWLMSRVTFDGRVWSWSRWSPRDTWLLGVTTAVVVVAMIPVGYVALTAPPDNYAAQFGEADSPMALVLERLEIVLIPTMPALARFRQLLNDPAWIFLLLIPSLIWIRMMVGGLAVAGKKNLWPVVIASVWLTLGIASYVPWPGGDAFYMAPFAFGSMFGAAHALNAMMGAGRVARIGTASVCVLLLCITSIESNTTVQRYRLRAHLNGDLVEQIGVGGDPPYLVGAVRIPPKVDRWGWAYNIAGFAKVANGVRVGQTKDLTCDDARKALETKPGTVVISRERGCGRLNESSVPLNQATYRAQWPWLWERHVVTDRMYVTRSESKVAQSAVRPVQAPL